MGVMVANRKRNFKDAHQYIRDSEKRCDRAEKQRWNQVRLCVMKNRWPRPLAVRTFPGVCFQMQSDARRVCVTAWKFKLILLEVEGKVRYKVQFWDNRRRMDRNKMLIALSSLF